MSNKSYPYRILRPDSILVPSEATGLIDESPPRYWIEKFTPHGLSVMCITDLVPIMIWWRELMNWRILVIRRGQSNIRRQEIAERHYLHPIRIPKDVAGMIAFADMGMVLSEYVHTALWSSIDDDDKPLDDAGLPQATSHQKPRSMPGETASSFARTTGAIWSCPACLRIIGGIISGLLVIIMGLGFGMAITPRISETVSPGLVR